MDGLGAGAEALAFKSLERPALVLVILDDIMKYADDAGLLAVLGTHYAQRVRDVRRASLVDLVCVSFGGDGYGAFAGHSDLLSHSPAPAAQAQPGGCSCLVYLKIAVSGGGEIQAPIDQGGGVNGEIDQSLFGGKERSPA
jgi:hypothetical protein